MVKNLLLQVVFFAGIFMALTWFKQRHMLDDDVVVSLPAHFQQPVNSLTTAQAVLLSADKTNLVYFFAPWCQVCHLSIGNLQQVADRRPDLNIVAIALDYQQDQQVEDFIAQHQLSVPVVLGDEELKQQFRIIGYPSYYLIDKTGRITARSLGYSTELGLLLRAL